MTEITVTSRGGREFDVDVKENSRHTRHRVSVPARVGDVVLEGDLENVVRESFRFLLEREPATSILREFSLDVITRYFPEYPEELARRLG
ncbi:MAG TPA: hypothetical protein VIL34_03500 [Actinopolymorphaceae bacterium]|jgi:hypothetical protein